MIPFVRAQRVLRAAEKRKHLVCVWKVRENTEAELCGMSAAVKAWIDWRRWSCSHPHSDASSSAHHTSVPCQNMGHFFHGSSLALPSHVLRYGLRTINGSTGGDREDAVATVAALTSSAAETATCMVGEYGTRLWKGAVGLRRGM